MTDQHNHSHITIKASDINRSFLTGIGLNVVYVIIEFETEAEKYTDINF